MNENGRDGFQAKIKDLFTGCGCAYFKVHGHAMQKSGWPDNYVSHRVWHGWLELKVDNNQLDALQKKVIHDLREREDNVFVLRFINDSYKIFIEDEDRNCYDFLQFTDKTTGMDILRKLASII